jgi:hypothetical protein
MSSPNIGKMERPRGRGYQVPKEKKNIEQKAASLCRAGESAKMR